MSLTTIQSINAEIKLLEEQKKLVEKRDAEVPQAVAVLQRYASVLTPAQRRKVAKILGDAVDTGAPAKASASADPKRPRKKIGRVLPKYRLPTGETWTGRGRTPTAFVAWEKGAEGKAWRKANEGMRFPAIADAAAKKRAKAASSKSPKTAAKKVAKKSKKAAVK